MPNQLGQLQDRGTTKALQVRFSLSPDYTLNLMPEIAAVIPFDMPELLFHQGWRRWQRASIAPATAAQFGESQLRNPAGSGVIIIIEQIMLDVGTAGNNVELGVTFNAVDLATVDTGGIPRDTRVTNTGSIGVVSHTTAGAGLTTGGQVVRLQALASFIIPGPPYILTPGNALILGNGGANDKLEVNWYWRERIIQEQENTP